MIRNRYKGGNEREAKRKEREREREGEQNGLSLSSWHSLPGCRHGDPPVDFFRIKIISRSHVSSLFPIFPRKYKYRGGGSGYVRKHDAIILSISLDHEFLLRILRNSLDPRIAIIRIIVRAKTIWLLDCFASYHSYWFLTSIPFTDVINVTILFTRPCSLVEKLISTTISLLTLLSQSPL